MMLIFAMFNSIDLLKMLATFALLHSQLLLTSNYPVAIGVRDGGIDYIYVITYITGSSDQLREGGDVMFK